MQTFLPYPDMETSAECLDRQRLGKQRIEALQILHCNLGLASTGWARHPAVRMWRGYEQALASYGLYVCTAWCNRGYTDAARDEFLRVLEGCPEWTDACWPPWFGGPIHASHRAALLAKDPEHYAQFGWVEEPKIEYVWPEEATP